MLTFLATVSAGKFCFDMTHNALVEVLLSVDFTTNEQSADNISDANVSEWQKKISTALQNITRYEMTNI